MSVEPVMLKPWVNDHLRISRLKCYVRSLKNIVDSNHISKFLSASTIRQLQQAIDAADCELNGAPVEPIGNAR